MKPMPTPTSMSSARILSGSVGPLTTRRTVSRKDRQSRTNAICTAMSRKLFSGHQLKASSILRSKPSLYLAHGLVDIGAIDRMDEERPAVVRNLDRQGARRQCYQIGEQGDFEVAAHLQRISEDAGPKVHPRRGHQPRHAPARQDEFLDEKHGERQYPAAAESARAAFRAARARDRAPASRAAGRGQNSPGVKEPVSAAHTSASRILLR